MSQSIEVIENLLSVIHHKYSVIKELYSCNDENTNKLRYEYSDISKRQNELNMKSLIALESERSKMKVESESLLVKKGQIQREIDELDRKCANDKGIVSNLESQLQTFTAESNQYDNTTKSLTSQISILQNELSLRNTMLQDLKNQYNEKQIQSNSLTQSYEEINKNIEDISNRIIHLQGEIKSITIKSIELQSKEKELNDNYIKIQEDIKRSEEYISQKSIEITGCEYYMTVLNKIKELIGNNNNISFDISKLDGFAVNVNDQYIQTETKCSIDEIIQTNDEYQMESEFIPQYENQSPTNSIKKIEEDCIDIFEDFAFY